MILTLDSIRFAWGEREVLSGASLSVQPGELTALVGANGAGKTTLLRIAAGLLEPAAGLVRFGDTSRPAATAAYRATLVSSVFPSDFIPQAVTVRGFLSLCASADLPAWRQADPAPVIAAMDFTGCAHLAGSMLTELSSGELQLVLIASALSRDTGILVFDEPLSHLDITRSAAILRLLKRIAESGRAVLCSVHDINLALQIPHRIAALVDGSTIYEGNAAGFSEHPLAERTFGGAFARVAGAHTTILLPQGAMSHG
jgi:iron complex transport system ATP-binding protein